MVERRKFGSDKTEASANPRSSEAMEHFTHDEIFRVMVDDSPLPVSIQNNEWKFVFVNEAYCRYTGYPVNELLGRDPKSFLFPPEDNARLVQKRLQASDLTNKLLPEYSAVRELVRKDGERVRFHVVL